MTDVRLTLSAVNDLDGFGRLQALHEAAVGHLSDGRLGELTQGMRALTVLFAVTGEIDNGGFAALMYNSTGRWTSEAIRAGRLVGSEPHAQVFERFVEMALEGDAEMDDDARNARLEAMSDSEETALEALNDEFYALPSIERALSAYVEARPDQFFSDVPTP